MLRGAYLKSLSAKIHPATPFFEIGLGHFDSVTFTAINSAVGTHGHSSPYPFNHHGALSKPNLYRPRLFSPL